MEAGTDETARLIAAWGAGIATLLLLLEILKFIRGRPKVAVSCEPFADRNGKWISLRLVNPPSAPPVTVIEAGLMARDFDLIESMSHPEGRDPAGTWVRPSLPVLADDEPLYLGPGQARTLIILVQSMPAFVDDDGRSEFRAYALDAEGRVMRGNRGCFFVDLLQMGWQPEERSSAHALATGRLTLVQPGKWGRVRMRLRTWRQFRMWPKLRPAHAPGSP